MDPIRKLVASVVALLMNPAVVLILCGVVEEVAHLILTEMQAFAPPWNRVVSVSVACVLVGLRAVKLIASMQQAKAAQQAALEASAKKRAEEMVP